MVYVWFLFLVLEVVLFCLMLVFMWLMDFFNNGIFSCVVLGFLRKGFVFRVMVFLDFFLCFFVMFWGGVLGVCLLVVCFRVVWVLFFFVVWVWVIILVMVLFGMFWVCSFLIFFCYFLGRCWMNRILFILLRGIFDVFFSLFS